MKPSAHDGGDRAACSPIQERNREAIPAFCERCIPTGHIMSTNGSSDDATLNERLAFIGLDAGSCANIARLKMLVDRALPQALDTFYAKVRTNAKAGRFFRL